VNLQTGEQDRKIVEDLLHKAEKYCLVTASLKSKTHLEIAIQPG
jgi:uncharacterized OsmC-like protein